MIIFSRVSVKEKHRKSRFRVVQRRLVLASSSPYRRALLARLQIPFDVATPGIDETALPHESAAATAVRLARQKAQAVGSTHAGAVVIGSDQVALLAGRPLGKAGNHGAALRQLLDMRGQEVWFHTAVCVLDAATGRTCEAEVPTAVQFRHYSEEQADRYLRVEQPYDCAGSAKIEAYGIVLVERVESTDPTALIGLPLITLCTFLAELGMATP
jgi:septum formation protein